MLRLEYIRNIALACFAISSINTNAEKTNSVVLNYDDFGPQVISNNIIGMKWWQWQAHGDSRPKGYNIKVVVYHNIPLENIKQRYPVIPEKQQDYRYVSYPKAVSYLNRHIAENLIPSVTTRLQLTKRTLQNTLEK